MATPFLSLWLFLLFLLLNTRPAVSSKTYFFDSDLNGITNLLSMSSSCLGSYRLFGSQPSCTEDVAAYNSNLLVASVHNVLKDGDTLVFPKKKIYFRGGIIIENVRNITFDIRGEIIFTSNPATWPTNDEHNHVLDALVFVNCSFITIRGAYPYGHKEIFMQPGRGGSVSQQDYFIGGVINGNGQKWWNLPYLGYAIHLENRPRLLKFLNSSDLLVENILLLNSPFWTTLFENIRNLEIRYVEIQNRRTNLEYHNIIDISALNTDGIDITGDTAYVHDVTIWTQDDCIAVKDGSQNMLFENINASGLGLAIGSIGSSHNRNITFRNCYLFRTVKGIYVKFRNKDRDHSLEQVTGQESSVASVGEKCPCAYEKHDYGLIEDVLFENIIIEEAIQFAIWLGPAHQSNIRDPSCCTLTWPLVPWSTCSGQPNGKLKNMTFRNILINRPVGTGVILGTEENHFESLVFDNVIFNYGCKEFNVNKRKISQPMTELEEQLIFSSPYHLLAQSAYESANPGKGGSLFLCDEYVERIAHLFLGFILFTLAFFNVMMDKLSVRKICTSCFSILYYGSLGLLGCILYGLFVHINIDISQPEKYYACEHVHNSIALNNTWPIPHCFEDRTTKERQEFLPDSSFFQSTNERYQLEVSPGPNKNKEVFSEVVGDISCLRELDLHMEVMNLKWLSLVPVYVLMSMVHMCIH